MNSAPAIARGDPSGLEPREGKDDPYANAALKYAALIDLEPGARVSLQGPYWSRMTQEFQSAGFPVSTSNRADCAFVGLDLTELRNRGAIRGAILGLKESLKPNGIAAVLTTNALAPGKLGRGLTPGETRRAIAGAGLSLMREYLPLPTLESVEMFQACFGQTIHLRREERWVRRMMARIGLYQILHGEHLFFLTGDLMQDRLPMAWVARWHLAGMGEDPGPLATQRFYLRRRGALLVVLSDEYDTRRMVLRVATSDAVADVLERNATFGEKVRTHPPLDEGLRRLIPRSMGSFVEQGRRTFMEEYLEGEPAWMLGARGRLERHVRTQAFDILRRLQQATVQPAPIDDRTIERLIGSTIAAVASRFDSTSGTIGLLSEMRERFASGFSGRTLPLVWSHGDYGLGNLLTDPHGNVTALIDWDTFVEADLPGIDWCHFVLSSDRNAGLGVMASTRALIERGRATGYLAPDFKGYGMDDYGLNTGDMIRIPCLATLRDLARSAVYPSEFRGDESGYLHRFGLLNQMLAEADGG
ncbi:MAG TPA: phosphotransferase [Gemmatimonadales bacterium]|nr:phosphotransferase [Gemmatimonadales bacterium]